MTEPRKVVIGNAELWLGDCRQLRDQFGKVDALISDPPYGQRHKTNVSLKGGLKTENGSYRINARRRIDNGYHGSDHCTVWPDAIAGDDEPFDPAPWLGIAPRVLLWGAHRFADRLPPGTWLVWDKVPTGKVRDQGDGEAAWLNDDPPRPMRLFRLLWDGVCVGSAARDEVTAGQQRVHPTQKPVVLMDWCLAQAGVEPGQTALDPYMGAGSTGVACARRGIRFVGCEIEPLYFETACERIRAAQEQGDLLRDILPASKPVQEGLEL